MECRESVYTQLARAINRFSEHKLNKVDLYNECVRLIEIADEDEKNDRLRYKKFWDEQDDIMPQGDVPYSNWEDGLNMVSD